MTRATTTLRRLSVPVLAAGALLSAATVAWLPPADAAPPAVGQLSGPASATIGSTVTITDTLPARTTDATFSVYFHVLGENGYDARRTVDVPAGQTSFTVTYAARQDERYYVQDSDGNQTNTVLTQAVPVLRGPATQTVARNATVTISGVAGLDASSVTIHFHKAGTPSNDYRIGRVVQTSSSGAFTRPFVADVDYRFYVTGPNGLKSATYLVQVR